MGNAVAAPHQLDLRASHSRGTPCKWAATRAAQTQDWVRGTLAESELPALLRGVAMKYLACWILPIAALASACAGIPKDDGEAPALARYLAYAGEPVDRFTFPQRIRGWQAVDREHLLVRVGPREAYLLGTGVPCVGLQTSRRIGLTSKVGRTTVTSGRDEIVLEHDRCRITEIRPLDLDRLRADEQAATRDGS
jgi:hypothetical protein